MTKFVPPTSDDRPIWDVWLSMHYLPAVTVADEMDIFKSLHTQPGTAEEVAARLGYDRRTTVAVVRMLAALDFLVRREGRYHLNDVARLYLLGDSPFYWGHMLGHDFPLHVQLRDRLTGQSPTGRPGVDGRSEASHSRDSAASAWARGQIDTEGARRVAATMHSHSLPAAIGVAHNGDFAGVQRLLDVGGGSGGFAIALAQQHPDMHCTIMELPAMCEVASEYIKDAGVADQVGTVAVDMFRERWPRGYDGMFFSNVWHDWNLETCSWLARRAFDALESNGRIYLHEMLLDDGDGPLTAVAFSMHMLATQGQQFTFVELKELLEKAGFTDVKVKHTYGYYSLITGSKKW